MTKLCDCCQMYLLLRQNVLVVKAKVEGFTLNLRRAVKVKPSGGAGVT